MDIVIVGGGPAGITAAYNLSRKNFAGKIHLIEKNSVLGGLARSHTYAGKFTFDIGPKRFHTEDPEVAGFISEIGKHVRMRTINRSSKVYFLNRYLSWPLERADIFRLPAGIALKTLKDLLFQTRFQPQDMASFQNYILRHYGHTLFEIFFKPYTEKFLHIPVESVHSDWARTGINRTIITPERQTGSLLELFRHILLPPKSEACFLYPENGGTGTFWNICAGLAKSSGKLSIRRNRTVRKILHAHPAHRVLLDNGEEIDCDYLFWSGKLPDLLDCLGISRNLYHLPYMDTLFADLVIDASDAVRREAFCQWLYISSPLSRLSRISFPRLFNSNNIPKPYEGICAEITVKENDHHCEPGEIIRLVLEELKSIGLFRKKARLYHSHVRREQATYPVYHRHYRDEVQKAFEAVGQFSERIVPFGRCGSFWYNNMDHSIKQALVLTNQFAEGRRPEFNFRDYFGVTA